MKIQGLLILSMLVGVAQTADAHTGLHPVAGWLSGFVHPFFGLDHLLAMLAVGLWAASVSPSPRQSWRLPAVFLAVMVLGGGLGAAGWALPGTEAGVAASVVLLGLLTAARLRLPPAVASTLVGLFALFHGLAHGAEMAQDADFLAYALGFVCATGLLHLAGVFVGWRLLPLACRASGAAIGGAGLFLLLHGL